MASPPVRGFVLQPTYRIVARRPIVHLHGVLESGESFLVRDDREVPRFYVEKGQAAAAARWGVTPKPSRRRTLRGEPVARVEVSRPPEVPGLRARLIRQGVRTYEADVRFAMRYLIDRGIRGSIEIRGESSPEGRIARVFENPAVEPADWTPDLRVLSFDIETDPRAQRLLAVALHGPGVAEVILLSAPELEIPPGAIPVTNEAELLELFARRVREIDPDILTGWNIIDFDLPVLKRIADKRRVPLELGRESGEMTLPPRSGSFVRPPSVPGRVVLDGIRLLRGAFVRMESYALDAVAREVLGEGKLVTEKDRGEEILRLFHEDRRRFVEYNLTDARLVVEILEKLRLVELSVERSRLTGMPLDRVNSSIAAFDFLYLSELHRKEIVAPTVGQDEAGSEPTAGGAVLKPEPGLFENVLVFDFKSLYPSLIRTFQIDPLGLVRDDAEDGDFIRAPNGARFRREKGILTRMLDELFPAREAARREGNAVASQAIKILMNSFYGVLGASGCRFHDARLANAITGWGRELLLWSKERCESHGFRVLYGDTDSLFVAAEEPKPWKAWRAGERLRERLNGELAEHVRCRWRVESRLELELERLYLRFYLPVMRHSTEGARKRYVGLVEEGGRRRVVFTGMEAVRTDWTELARRVQKELFERLFADEPVLDHLRQTIARLRAGELDEALVYRKLLRKRPEAYTATTPPHVAAARKLAGPAPRAVRYVMTTDGPEPVEARRHPLDHEHYVEKQIRPIAEPVLDLLGLRFLAAAGGEEQLELF